MAVVEFVSQYVELDANGRGHCPFHDDQVQSFQVNLTQNYWHCYAGCGGGSIIDFWMKWRQTHGQPDDFTATITELAKMLL
jgi:DNA primase